MDVVLQHHVEGIAERLPFLASPRDGRKTPDPGVEIEKELLVSQRTSDRGETIGIGGPPRYRAARLATQLLVERAAAGAPVFRTGTNLDSVRQYQKDIFDRSRIRSGADGPRSGILLARPNGTSGV